MHLSAREQFYLMTKLLGVESAEQKNKFQNNLQNKNNSLCAHGSSQESYGSPKAGKQALLKKVEGFLRLTNKDNYLKRVVLSF